MRKITKKTLILITILFTFAMFAMYGCSKDEADDKEKAPTSESSEEQQKSSDVTINIGTLKGPTAMGLVSLMSEENENYNFEIVTAADELSAKIIKGEVDIATVPANLAAVLYNKTDREITVLNINTLGVLYVVTADDSINTLKDLEGKTVYMTGKGTTPEYAFNYLMNAYDVDSSSITIEFKSESTEVAAVLAQDENAIGILPQPFVTVAMTSNDKLKMVMSFSELWDKLDTDSSLVTGVTIVRNEFLEKNKGAVEQFLEEHEKSVKYAQENKEEAAALVGKYDIVKEAVALKALPYCNITYIAGEEMKTKLGAYLETLYEENSQSVGGSLPDEEFYYSH
ncbi:MAG: ABC transporter substrate-binding protein [Lachnospiraceae bacterium]